MNGFRIEYLIKEGLLRKKYPDMPRIRSLIDASEKNSHATLKNIELVEETSTIIFRELYESIRQLGEARWFLSGYECHSHELAMEILMKEEIKDKLKLRKLDRFREIRHDANYRGYKITIEQAQEIIDFWNACGEELIKKIEEKIK